MNTHHRPQLAAGAALPRAILGFSVRSNLDPNTVLNKLLAQHEAFQADHQARYSRIEAAVDDLNLRLTAGALNGHGGPAAADKRAVSAMGRFAKSGDPEAFQGLTLPQASGHKGSDPDGGYLVPDEVSTTILSLQRTRSPMRRLARVVKTKSHSYKYPINRNGTASGWVSERGARTETTAMNLAMLEFPAGEIYANPAVSQGLLDDSDFDLGAFLLEEISKTFDEQEGAAFVSGDALDKPEGFLNRTTYIGAGNGNFGEIQAVKSGHASSFATTNPWTYLVDVLQSLKAQHRQNSTWLMNSTTQGAISKFVDSNGQPVWRQSLVPGTPDTLLGRPVELDENMPDIAANAFPIAIGDWMDGYLINDRFDVRVIRDPYTNKPFVHFYSTKRVGGGVLNAEAIKLLKIAA